MVDKALRVEVRSGGSPPNIYRGQDRIERSLHRYPNEQAAREAGTQVMARLIAPTRRQRS
jgi:hypothetical protein